MAVIETLQLSKRFGDRTVVDQVSLSVRGGEIFGFLGRNGAGKSTFINMLTGIIRPSSGRIRMFGHDVQTEDWKRRIGVLPDYSTFYDSLSAADHLRYFARVKKVGLTHEDCMRILDAVELGEHAARKAKTFSFGMKKKLGIAQAMVGDPEILFLDEPTSGVDVESALHIQELLLRLHQQGKTIFMTSHNLHEVEKICTRIAIMKSGKIASEGSLTELQAAQQAWRQVQVRHSAFSAEEQAALRAFVESLSRNIRWGEGRFQLQVDEEQKVAALVCALVQARVDIYGVNVDVPSLEKYIYAGGWGCLVEFLR
ncbi:ABC-type multidrug transport system, ATPase component [Brevibacillus sp. CF112]|uniref:ABC transporter ATP-binding protein n=1 Tax=Brevibacillus TaxID=55080 RepID=UPI000271B2D2|nr:ABC transporter ATP-binding protein [Brevibacillus sp. CF112]EJL45905.1 ABC-type multidrug transport system, ATPase component [Brevibacillus sp. CF112]